MNNKLLSTSEVCNKYNISQALLYELKEEGLIYFPTKHIQQYLWDEETLNKLSSILKNNTKNYKTTTINNRRYLGNKYKLLPFIKEIVKKHCKNITVIADIFAGTGAVSSAFTDKVLITNDNMYSNYICHLAWFGTEKADINKIKKIIIDYNNTNPQNDNYMSINFSNTYFNKDVCRKIGFIREDIETKFNSKIINERERAVLITSLLYAMDKIANTCGHYDAYRKSGELNKKLELSVPLISNNLNKKNKNYNIDANELVKNIKADLAYIDPPYNSRQYCDAYHLLENVARWQKPKVSGVALKMQRDNLKSDYCTQNATKAFEDLISNINAKYILLSYNNMSNKGNSRSNARINDKDIIRILSNKGKVTVFSKEYKAFTTGKSKIENNEERLFLCVCNDNVSKQNNFIQSPLNYTGGKYKLLSQILPLFPKKMSSFVDLFCGGCNVGININSDKIILNDTNSNLIGIYNTFKKLDKKEIFSLIQQIISKYNLSNTSKYGYEKYSANSSEGLTRYNKDNFIRMRNDFNSLTKKDDYYYILLYVLIVFSFNNQIRFNKEGNYNLPVGKRDFNVKMQKKLSDFLVTIHKKNYVFTNNDFRKLKINKLKKDSFVYCDPPYLITCATYNEQAGWTQKDEKDLLEFLNLLNKNNIKFALSNVLANKGKENKILMDWINKYNYKVIHLNNSYSNSNYRTKNKEKITDEVLIINY